MKRQTREDLLVYIPAILSLLSIVVLGFNNGLPYFVFFGLISTCSFVLLTGRSIKKDKRDPTPAEARNISGIIIISFGLIIGLVYYLIQ